MSLGNLKLLKLFHADGVDMHALNCKISNDSVLTNLNLNGNLFTSLPDFCQTLSKLEELCINSCPLLQPLTGLPRNIICLLSGGGYTNSPERSHVSYHGCRSLIEVEGCYKKVSIRNVDRRIKRNLRLLELEQSFLDLDMYKDIKVLYLCLSFICCFSSFCILFN